MGNVKGRVRQQDRPIESNNNQSATKKYNNFCTTQLKITTEKFFWMIENFSEHDEKRGEYLQSTEFISKAPACLLLKWRMKMYPNGLNEEYKDYIALFLHLTDSNNEEVEAKYHISISKPKGDKFILKTFEYRKYVINSDWGSPNLIKREDLLKAENGYLDGGQLTIVCTVTIKQKSVKVKNVGVPGCRLQEDVSHLFETGQFSDCKIISDNGKKEFKVHKNILWCRSPVFRAMFQHRTTENNENVINIVDIKGDVIEKMLRFIYSAEEPNWGEMTEDLLIASEKYELIRLKLLCERQLVNSLENANALALLSLANLHRAKHLKTNTIDYIKMHLKEVMESEDWKTYADEQLKDQILKAIAK